MCRVHPPRFPFQRHVIQCEYSLEPNPLKKIGPHCALVCSSEYDKISGWAPENIKVTSFLCRRKIYTSSHLLQYQVVYFLCQGENLHIKFLIFVWNTIFPLPSQLLRRNKKYMSSLYFHKSRRPGDDPGKRAQAV